MPQTGELSYDDVFGALPAAPAAAPAALPPGGLFYDGGRGISVQVGGDPDAMGSPQPTHAAPAAQSAPQTGELSYDDVFGAAQPAAASPAGPDLLGEAWKGLSQPFQTLGQDAMDAYHRRTAEATAPPPSLGEAAGRSVRNLADLPRLAGDVLAASGAPLQGLLRPAAALAGRYLPTPYEGPKLTLDGGKLGLTAPKALDRTEAALNVANTALQGARPTGVNLGASRAASLAETRVPGRGLTQQTRAVAPQMPVTGPAGATMLSKLHVDKRAAYERAGALGASYTGKAKADLKRTLVDGLVAEGVDQGANPGAWSAMKRAEAVLSGKKPVTLTDLDNLRQTAWRQAAGLKGPDKDAERYYGQKIIDAIDQFVDTAQPGQMASGGNPAAVAQVIRDARAANQRYKKVQTVTNELDSAKLRASSTYAGGNKANAIRQELRPLVDPASNRRMRGLTGAEAKGLREVVDGTRAQNAIRQTGKLLDPRGLIGMSLQTVLGMPSHGMSTIATLPGMAASELSNHLTTRAVQNLLDLMAGGKSLPKKPAVTPRVAIGAGVVAAPALRQSDRSKTTAQSR